MPAALCEAALKDLPASVGRPGYDLRARRAGIVHLGFGGFHRAHMARYTHNLMQARHDALDWGIVGAGLLRPDQEVAEALAPQDVLYTLVERSADRDEATVIGSVCEVLCAVEDPAPLLSRMEQARIVSLTVTEAGYGLDRATKRLDPTLPAVAADLAEPGHPKTPVGLLVEAFRRRKQAGREAFTAMSCDNIQHNGEVLRHAVLDFADRVDPGLSDWIAREARFPSSMVDRITPSRRPQDTAFVAETWGVQDRSPILCEDFRQWVIQDDFANGRPDWNVVGAQFVHDVSTYEMMKLRLLNTTHLAVSVLGQLLGHEYVHQATTDEAIRRYAQVLMVRETEPTLPPVPGVDLGKYQEQVIRRFSNPKIKDTVARVNADAPLNYLLDPIRDLLAAGAGIELLALALAAWMHRMRGFDEAGEPITISHPLAEDLRRRAELGGADPRPLLAIKSLFGDLGESARLIAETSRWLSPLHDIGVRPTLERALLAPNAPV